MRRGEDLTPGVPTGPAPLNATLHLHQLVWHACDQPCLRIRVGSGIGRAIQVLLVGIRAGGIDAPAERGACEQQRTGRRGHRHRHERIPGGVVGRVVPAHDDRDLQRRNGGDDRLGAGLDVVIDLDRQRHQAWRGQPRLHQPHRPDVPAIDAFIPRDRQERFDLRRAKPLGQEVAVRILFLRGVVGGHD